MSPERVTLITGASQGIGRELALTFAEAGDSLVLVARSEANLSDTAEAANALGAEALVVPTDITDPAEVDAMASTALERFGHVDVLINNSGIGGPSGPLWELDLDGWRQAFAVNVEGVFLVSKALLPQMIEAEAARSSLSVQFLANDRCGGGRRTPRPSPLWLASPARWPLRSECTGFVSISSRQALWSDLGSTG